MKNKAEIACAAIMDDNERIWLGKRHSDCFFLMMRFGVKEGASIQGFVTTDNIFVNRTVAKKIAVKAGQTNDRNLNEYQLYSEDLY